MDRPSPDFVERAADVRRLLSDIAVDMSGYSSNDLLCLKHAADAFSWLVRAELRARDARMVDEACALRIGDAA